MTRPMEQQMTCCWRETRDEYLARMRAWKRRMICRARSCIIMVSMELFTSSSRAFTSAASRRTRSASLTRTVSACCARRDASV